MQTNKDNNSNNGGVVISSDVISSIAVNAAKDIDGVAGFASNHAQIKDIITKMSVKSSPVVVSNENADLIITIYIKIFSGYNIQDVASKVQVAVKQAVQNMTGKVVTRVNVSVSDLATQEEEKE